MNTTQQKIKALTGLNEQEIESMFTRKTGYMQDLHLSELVRVAKLITEKVPEEYLTIKTESEGSGRIQLWTRKPITGSGCMSAQFLGNREEALAWSYEKEKELEKVMEKEFPEIKPKEVRDKHVISGGYSPYTQENYRYGLMYEIKSLTKEEEHQKEIRLTKEILLNKASATREKPWKKKYTNKDFIIFSDHQARELEIVEEYIERLDQAGWKISLETEKDLERYGLNPWKRNYLNLKLKKENEMHELINHQYEDSYSSPFYFSIESKESREKQEKEFRKKLEKIIDEEWR